MGGNALSFETSRLEATDYFAFAKQCVQKLHELFPGGRFEAIEAYRQKPDFGDLDILVSHPSFDSDKAAKSLAAVEVVKNGPVISIGVPINSDKPICSENVFQVDLIKIDAASFDYAAGYFSFNDLGNLIGRTAHSMGVSHRHDGLYYYLRDGDYKFREILLTKNYDEALYFLGYDPKQFRKGFDTLDEIFHYVANSTYFNPDIFLLHNRNAISRTRDRKRKTYMGFLDFCEKSTHLSAFTYPDSKEFWLPTFFGNFPHFKAEYEQALSDLNDQRIVKQKFNGKLVAELTGLEGKLLGAFMKNFKDSFSSQEEMHLFVLHQSDVAIKSRILEFIMQNSNDESLVYHSQLAHVLVKIQGQSF